MKEQWKDNLERKIENIIQRIAEIEAKQNKLESTKNQLYSDLAKNQELLGRGPEVPQPKQNIELSESIRQQILKRSSAFSKK